MTRPEKKFLAKLKKMDVKLVSLQRVPTCHPKSTNRQFCFMREF